MYTDPLWYQSRMLNPAWYSPQNIPPTDALTSPLMYSYRTPFRSYANFPNSLPAFPNLNPSSKNAMCQTESAPYNIEETVSSDDVPSSPVSVSPSPRCTQLVLYNWTPINFQEDGTCCVIGFLKDSRHLALSAAISSVTQRGKVVSDGLKTYKLSGPMCWEIYQSIHSDNRKISLPRDLYNAFQNGFPQHNYNRWALGIFFFLHQEENDDHIQSLSPVDQGNSPESSSRSCDLDNDTLLNYLRSTRILERKSASKYLARPPAADHTGQFSMPAPVMRLETAAKIEQPLDLDQTVSRESSGSETENRIPRNDHNFLRPAERKLRSRTVKDRSHSDHAQNKLTDRIRKFSKELRHVLENDHFKSPTGREKLPDFVCPDLMTSNFDRNPRECIGKKMAATEDFSSKVGRHIPCSNKKLRHREKSSFSESISDNSSSSHRKVSEMSSNILAKSHTESRRSRERQCNHQTSPVFASLDENSVYCDETTKGVKSALRLGKRYPKNAGKYSQVSRRRKRLDKSPSLDSTGSRSSFFDERPSKRSLCREKPRRKDSENLSEQQQPSIYNFDLTKLLSEPKSRSDKYRLLTSQGVVDVKYLHRTRSGRLSKPCLDFWQRQEILSTCSNFSACGGDVDKSLPSFLY